ncbi:TonB-dependent receptor [Beijerinckia indica]|uniref:TonB-dependent receptor n=1 Tax=Beijerinckia indica subsp. indica (strain ATCC 9039 / DSM 1715 / NCIMB 8712) TaxID=395963 RepID=B2IG30_BEII9|nr:TonB-dependent receptor [Beijerinckia indica]ACB95767.1 TonB-dependent receptor [Beijerinckia indica subsp. indica ATCC 9039]
MSLNARHLLSRGFGITFLVPSLVPINAVMAQTVEIGAVDVNATQARSGGEMAVGRDAPPGSAAALAPSQSSLLANEPGSIVSEKIIQDVIKPGGDFNDVLKFTPGFYSSNPNGSGDAKGGWRGFSDGQYNVTYDGIPFGDANDPSHHSGAYFPSPFMGQVVLDRGPGPASQVGYAPFGGTLAMFARRFTDKPSAELQFSYGEYGTFTNAVTIQSGANDATGGTRFLAQFSHTSADGMLAYGRTMGDFGLLKIEQPIGDNVVLTGFATYGQEHYNNVGYITAQQLALYGKNYGSLNNNPATNNYWGYNTSSKQTDLEYVGIQADVAGFHLDDKVYTYSYTYPTLQNNGADLTQEGPATITSAKQYNGTKVPIIGVGKNDVTGYLKNNNYRAYGNIFNVSHDINEGLASGTVRAGVWVEHVDNQRFQQYIDYTSYKTYTALGNPDNASYKTWLSSHIDNVQPYFEYEWRPVENLTITPGYKYVSFTRDHNATINQTTLLPLNYQHTYTANLPFANIRYRFTPNLTAYGQVSQGFLAPTVSAYYVPDPSANSIAPQSTTNYQVGMVYRDETITAAFDAYLLKATNFPIAQGVVPNTVYVNGGTAVYKGLEAEMTYAFGNGLAVYVNGSLSSAQFVQGPNIGLAVPNAPRYTGAAGFIYDKDQFFGSFLFKAIGNSFGDNGQVLGSNANKIGAYNTTDLAVGYRTDALHQIGFGQNAEVRFGVNNIFDNRSIVAISGNPTTNLTGLTYGFQPNRFIYGAVTLRF